MKYIQYTIRNIPPKVDHYLRTTSEKSNMSFNQFLVNILIRGTGLSEDLPAFHDLDGLSGTWKEDRKFDEALRAQDQIDPHLWK